MDWKTFTVEELKLECKKKDISGYSKLKKEELIKLLQKNKNNKLYYYTDPIGWGENIIKSMLKRKEWIYLEPEQRDKRFNAIKIIKGGKWNFYWKETPTITFPTGKIPLYYLEKPHKDVLQIINHFPNIEGIATKIGLTESLKKYKKEFEHIFPKTFIIRDRNDKNTYKQILSSENKYWIVKPDKEYGGLGIKFFDNSKKAIDFIYENIKKGLKLEDYRKEEKNVKEIKKDGWILQQYIKNPFLYKNRKFDIRIHILVKDSGEIYFCKYGYIRISSLPFTLQLSEKDEENAMIHITNQAYQETSELFGKFEEGNTLLLEDFMKYLQEEYGVRKGKFLYNQLIEDWKDISKLIIERTWNVINKKTKEVPNRRYYELIGLDYMIDEDFNTWLIEANFNPSLNDKTSWGREIVPQVLEETIEICVDPIFKEDKGKIPKKLKWFEQI